jgi:hypothetical protein
MNTYCISKEHKTHELQYIKTILNNNCPPQPYQNITTKIKKTTPDTPQNKNSQH